VTDEVPFGPAVARGVMCEPPNGVPALGPVLDAARRLDVDLFAIVEQDMYPCPPEKPLPIARRTRDFLRSCGTPVRSPDTPSRPGK
jgi:inosose dehydratase